ncbi:DUF1080 domain-containing protein [candidate division KSB1 bacterium]|nr:DUF1080 domain-containing protein [candidate division KSB1 bacterium]
MMKPIIVVCCTLFLLSCANTNNHWISLFNGKDLTGWKANCCPESFTVVDGAIRAHCTSDSVRSHLFYVGEDENELVRFKDFELIAIAKGEPNSNSGIFFHTDYSERDDKKHLYKGYEIQLNSSKKEKRKTGSLYAIVDLDETPVDDTQWFEVHLIVKGKNIQVNLDGQNIIDYTEPENPARPPNRTGRVLDPQGGAIALQAHDANSTWYFKEIRIRPIL